jgi:hypothetical protein
MSVIFAACVHSGDDTWLVRAFRTEAMATAWIENLRTIEKAWRQSGETKRPEALAITADGAEHMFVEEMEF